MKNHLLLSCLWGIAFCPALFSQQVSETLFGQPEWDSPIRIWQMPDGNIAAVTNHSDSSGGSANYLYHLDPNGAVTAQFNLPQLTYQGLVEPHDDGTFTYGYSGLLNGNPAYFHYRMNLSGQAVDSIVYSDPDMALGYGWVEKSSPDGGFVMAFLVDNFQPGQSGIYVVKINQAGTVAYKKFISVENPQIDANQLVVLPNGRVFVTIIDFLFGHRAVCFSPSGALLWTKALPQNPLFGFTQSIPLGNDEVAFFGDAGTPINGYAAVYSQNGSFAWNLAFNAQLPGFNPLVGFADANQVVLAGEYFTQGDIGMAVVKVAHDGQIVFAQKFSHLGGYNMTGGMDKNGNYVFSGFQWKDMTGGYQADNGYVLCLQSDGTLNWFAGNPLYKVNRMNDFCQLENGDVAAIGMAVAQPGAGQDFENYLFRVSGVGGLYSKLIHGKIVRDSIENCEPDAGEPELEGWLVKASTATGDRYTITDAGGTYDIRTTGDNASISITMPNALWQNCEPSYPVSLGNSDTAILDIAVRQVGQCPLLELSGSTAALRRCFDNTYHLNWCNRGTAPAENMLLTVTLDTFFTYISSSLPPAAFDGQDVIFVLGDLAVNQCGDLSITVNTSCEAEPGQVHCLEALLSADETCSNQPHTAAIRECQPNIGSYDPNDKRAFVNDTLHEGFVLQNTDIEYQIRFQNTGTDTAFNIVIVDTISGALDISTFKPGVSSHPYEYQLHGGNVVKFVFNNIQLPDSNINNAASQGFINYKISQKPDLPLLTAIENKADIYFDFNKPVGTNRHKLIVNKSTSTKVLPGSTAAVEAYPNPASDGLFWLESLDPARMLQRVWIFDAAGRLCSETQPWRNKVRLALPEPRGLYLVKTLLDDGRTAAVRMVR